MLAKEVAATTVLALPLVEFSVTTRDGRPEDPEDAGWPIVGWPRAHPRQRGHGAPRAGQ